MSLMDFKKPTDNAFDWVDDTFFTRATKSLMFLELLGVISIEDHKKYLNVLEVWLKENK